MSEEKVQQKKKSKIEVLEDAIAKLKDAQNSFISLVEKLATIQTDAMDSGLDIVSDGVARPFSSASACASGLETLVGDLELERNRLVNES